MGFPGRWPAQAWWGNLRDRRTSADYQNVLDVVKGSKDCVDRSVVGRLQGAWLVGHLVAKQQVG
jgi:hypothetical protein